MAVTNLIKKAIVLAAGKGTRLIPLTLAIPKEMIRVGTKPVIEHAIEVLKAGGVREILVVVGPKKEAIMDYLGSGKRLGVDIYYKIQDKPKGSADAVYQGKNFVRSEDFVVMYGDNYFKPYETIRDVVKTHVSNHADGTLLLHLEKDARNFGVVSMDKRNEISSIVEKPTVEAAESYRTAGGYLSIAGLLILNDTIFDFIQKTEVGKKGEIWLTDSVEKMRKNGGRIFGHLLKGVRYDIGTFESLKKADWMEQSRGY